MSPDRHLGHDARRGWRSLRRWARAPPWPVTTSGTPRERAARVTQYLAGHALEPGQLTALACAGALLA